MAKLLPFEGQHLAMGRKRVVAGVLLLQAMEQAVAVAAETLRLTTVMAGGCQQAYGEQQEDK